MASLLRDADRKGAIFGRTIHLVQTSFLQCKREPVSILNNVMTFVSRQLNSSLASNPRPGKSLVQYKNYI